MIPGSRAPGWRFDMLQKHGEKFESSFYEARAKAKTRCHEETPLVKQRIGMRHYEYIRPRKLKKARHLLYNIYDSH